MSRSPAEEFSEGRMNSDENISLIRERCGDEVADAVHSQRVALWCARANIYAAKSTLDSASGLIEDACGIPTMITR